MTKIKEIHVGSQVRTLSLKFYVEQLMPAADRKKYTALLQLNNRKANKICKEMESNYCKKFWLLVSNFKYKDYQVCAIYHNKDLTESEDSPFEVSSKKGHWHVLVWRDSWKKPKKRFRVGTIVRKLGLAYAPKMDSEIWRKHGAEVVEQSIANFFAYLTHETDQAILDGKTAYSRAEVAKNFDDAIANQMYSYYQKSKKKNSIDWDLLAEEAYQLGLNVGDYDKWVDTKLSIKQQAQVTTRKIHEKYMDGLELGIERIGALTRCSILLHGTGNIGKSYTTFEALKKMNLKVYSAREKSGKYDGLSAQDQALVFDDVGVSQALNVFDNRAVILHRRNSGDRPWLGNYAIVTTNAEPDEAISSMLGMGVSDVDLMTPTQRATFEALKSRLYICCIKNGELFLEKAQHRGDQLSFDLHDKLFIKFKKAFDAELKNYDKESKPVSKLEQLFCNFDKSKSEPNW